MLDVREAAKRLGISPFTLRAMARYRRVIPYYKVGRRIVFAPEDVDAFLARARVEARPPTGVAR